MPTAGCHDGTSRHRTIARLRTRAILAGVVHLCLSVAWASMATPQAVVLWLIGTTSVAVYFLRLLWRHAPDNATTATTALAPTFGWGTGVTLLRVACLSLLSGYLLSPPTPSQLWHVAGLYATIGAGDWLDGFLARRTGHETRLGELLDLQVDALGMLVAPIIAVTAGRLPVWYLLLSSAYFVFHAALALRRGTGRPCYQERLRPSAHARTFAGYQMTLVAAALVPILDAGTVHVVATILMVPSLVAFGRDWGVATGRLVPDTEAYRRLIERVTVSTRKVLPVLMRPIFVGAIFWPRPAPEWFDATSVVLTLAIGVGCVPRVATLFSLVMVGLAPIGTTTELVLVIAGTTILLLGSGYFSLYEPEERWFFGRHGHPGPGTATVAATVESR